MRKRNSITCKFNIARKASNKRLKKIRQLRHSDVDELSKLFDEMSCKDCKNDINGDKNESLTIIKKNFQLKNNNNNMGGIDQVNSLIDQFGKKLEIVPSKKLYYNFPNNKPNFVGIKSLSNVKLKNFFRIIKLNKYFIEYNKSNHSNGEITEIEED